MPESAGKKNRYADLMAANWAVVAAFSAYFCMYAFRKPYTAASFTGETFLGLDWKAVLVLSQVLGYTLSKFLGIKVVSELPPARRGIGIVSLVVLAELALFGFAVTPAPWSALFLFLNGLPLGMVFGLVLGFLEGRRLTEILAAGLCASFILADGVMKTVGTWLLENNVPEVWMPALSGLIFLPPLLLSVWMLNRISPPDERDVAQRVERTTLDRKSRWRLFRKYAVGLSGISVVYLLVTILRSVRADFAPEIWFAISGGKASSSLFTVTELWVATGVMLINGSLVLIVNNRHAFFVSLGLCQAGLVLVLASAIGSTLGLISPVMFVVLLGLGLYLPYAAVHITVFERLLALSRDKGTSSYLLYLVDSFGYLGYVALLLGKNFWGTGLNSDPQAIMAIFNSSLIWSSFCGILLLGMAWGVFAHQFPKTPFRSTN